MFKLFVGGFFYKRFQHIYFSLVIRSYFPSEFLFLVFIFFSLEPNAQLTRVSRSWNNLGVGRDVNGFA